MLYIIAVVLHMGGSRVTYCCSRVAYWLHLCCSWVAVWLYVCNVFQTCQMIDIER